MVNKYGTISKFPKKNDFFSFFHPYLNSIIHTTIWFMNKQSSSKWRHCFELLTQSNYTTSYPRSWIPSFEWIGMISTTEIVLFAMNYYWSTDNWVLAIEANQFISEAEIGTTKGICLKITKVSHVSLLTKWTPVIFIMRIIVCACSSASLREISKLMNMYSMLAIGVEPLHRARYLDWGLYWILTEGDKSSHIGLIGVENADGVSFSIDILLSVE